MQLCPLIKEFVRSLNQLQQLAALPVASSTADEKDNPKDVLQPQGIWQSTLHLQTKFQEILAITTADGMDLQTEARLRPLQTEAHRRLRLLSMEATRLRAAKQEQTMEKSRSQLTAHLDSLMQFAQGIKDEVCP